MKSKKRDILSSPRLVELRKKRRRVFWSKVFIIIFFVSLIFTSIVFLSRIDKLNISQVEVLGNKVIENEVIGDIVQSHLNGYYLYFIPKSNFLLYPKNRIKKELQNKFSRLQEISFSLNKTKTLSVSVVEREGKYVWCGEDLPAPELKVEDHNCSFVDDTGYVFDSAPYFSGDVYFKFFGKLNSSYFFPEMFNNFIYFKDAINAMALKASALLVKDDGDIEIYLSSTILSHDSPKIIFKNDFILEKTIQNLSAALATDPLKSDLKNKYNLLEYIDLRFGNKVYFKFSP